MVAKTILQTGDLRVPVAPENVHGNCFPISPQQVSELNPIQQNIVYLSTLLFQLKQAHPRLRADGARAVYPFAVW
jgi:hypothetical protein